MGTSDTNPRDARSPRTDAAAATPTAINTSAASFSSFSGAASALSPSRGLKRTRDVDALDGNPTPVSASIALTSRGDEPLAKRANASPDGGSSRGGSPAPGDALRISNELLRGDNALLQQQLAAAQSEKAALDVQLAQQKQRVRNLEEDLTRIYRRQKREAESRQTAHAQTVESLQAQLERLTKQLEDRPVLDPTVALLTPETTQEMDAFVAMCTQWQQKLTVLSAQLARQVARVEQAEVKAVVDGMAHRVEDAHRLSAVQTAEEAVEIQREVLRQQEQEMAALAERMKADRDDTEAFESMERVVLEQRVAELENIVDSAKGHEQRMLQQMASLREELATTRSGKRLIEESAWQQKLEEEAHMKDQLEALTVRCEAQQVQLTLLREDLSSLQAENDELAADLTARKQAAAGEDDTASIVTKQLEDRITELKEQLAETKKKARDTEAELRADLGAKMRDEAENLNNRIEVLTMNVDAKAKVIEKLSAEKTDLVTTVTQKDQALEAMHADAALLQQQIDAKNHKIETLEYEISELELNLEAKLKQAVDDANSEKLELQKQMTAKTCDWVELNFELKEVKRQLESKTLELQTLATERDCVKSKNAELRGQADKWQKQPDVAALEAKNKELVQQQELLRAGEVRLKEELVSVKRDKQQLQDEVSSLRAQVASTTADEESKPVIQQLQNGNVSLTPEIQARIAKLLVEKRAVENFLQQYFEVAEAKCQSLTAQVVQLEAKQASHRQHAQDSCQLLRMCAQIDACDSTVRASLLDVMTTLESIS